MASKCEPIFCCDCAVPVTNAYTNAKLHNDPNRGLHDAIFRSFVAFAVRRQCSVELMALIQGLVNEGSGKTETPPEASDALTTYTPLPPNAVMAPAFEPQSLKNNPLTSDTPYVMHLTSRHDFGPVYSHRYFVCPEDLEEDWIELTLIATNSFADKHSSEETFRIYANMNERQWFAQGDPFKFKAEKWDLKCAQDKRFFRLTLRPNLNMRGSLPAHSPQPLPAQLAGFQATATPTELEYPRAGLDSGYGSGTASASYAAETLQSRATPAPLEYTHTTLDSGYGSGEAPANYAAETCGGIQAGGFHSQTEYSHNEGEGYHVGYGSGAATTYAAEGFPSQIGYPHNCYDLGYGPGAVTSYAAELYGACQDYNDGGYFGQWRGRESGYVCEEPEETVEIKQVEF